MFKNHSDVRSMIYNYYHSQFMTNEGKDSRFQISDYKVDFKRMVEVVGGEEREILKLEKTHERKRNEDSKRNGAPMPKVRSKQRNFDKVSF